MKVDYKLPGLLPEAAVEPAQEHGEGIAEPFGAQLQRLRAPQLTDWREVLRLNTPAAGAMSLGPPPVPYGMESRDGVSQRAWWRAMLHKHRAVFQNSANGAVPVQRMLGLLQEAQGREDEIFARHFTERED